MRGTINTKLKVLVLRDNKSMVYTITRGTIPNPSLESAYMIDKTIGYIRLDRFSDSTYDEFVSSLKKLNSLGLKKLILDLRGNGGGYLNEATEILDEFINENKVPLLQLNQLWVNFQKKHEFNPVHNHSGLFSFIIFVQIPYDLEREKKEGPGSLSNSNFTSCLQFHPTTMLGRQSEETIHVDKSYEGGIYFFIS